MAFRLTSFMDKPKINYIFGRPPDGTDVLWRCEAKRYSYVIDPERELYGVTAPRLQMMWFPVIRRTPKGAWLSDKFVLLSANKRWACNTEVEALESFKRRKMRQIKILSTQLHRAEEDLALIPEDMKWAG